MQKNRRNFIKKLSMVGLAAGLGPLLSSKKSYSADKKIQWKMVTTWPKNFPGLGTGAEYLADLITKMSAGRLSVKVYGAGEIVPAMGVFDAVSRGTAQMGHGASYYWRGKSEATQFFASIPFGFNAYEMNAWLEFEGGQKLWDEVYAPFKLKGFAAGNTGVQMGGWYRKEIKKIEDFKGLKIRMPGLGGDVLKKYGATVVNLPGGEIFQSLKTGAIDATEWVGPYNDMAFGLHKAAKYYYTPGWHEPGTTLECMVHKPSFDALPKDLQTVVEAATQAANQHMLSEMMARNADSFSILKSKHPEVSLKEFSPEILKKLKKTTDEILQEIVKKDPLSKKVFESYSRFQKKSKVWQKFSEYTYGKTYE